jgi:hypothetical protein
MQREREREREREFLAWSSLIFKYFFFIDLSHFYLKVFFINFVAKLALYNISRVQAQSLVPVPLSSQRRTG